MKLTFRNALAIALVSSIGMAGKGSAQTVKGIADLGYTKPVTKVVGKEVITTFKIKNLSPGPIAGLKIDEFWYDKQGNTLPGGTRQFNRPFATGATVLITFKTPKDPKMDSNTYLFSHANGKVNAKILPKIE
jgi:hypothetical protein